MSSDPQRPASIPTAGAARPPRPMWQLVAGVIAASALLFVAAMAAPTLLERLGLSQPAELPDGERQALPWDVEPTADGGLRVFGLQVGGARATTLRMLQARWPDEQLQLALIETRTADVLAYAPAQPRGDAPAVHALEGYLESVRLGALQGKLVATAAVTPAMLAAWAARATQRERQASGAHRLRLAPADLDAAQDQPLAALVLLPAARIDEATAVQRFGAAHERLVDRAGGVHLLYPERGLAIAVDPAGKARPVLQYTSPATFETRLRAPLAADIAAHKAASQ